MASLIEQFYTKAADPSNDAMDLARLMSVYLALEDIREGVLSEDERIGIPRYAHTRTDRYQGVNAFSVGQEVTLKELLEAILNKDAQDASISLALHLAKKETAGLNPTQADLAFTKRMNDTALALGMNATTFIDPSGLPRMLDAAGNPDSNGVRSESTSTPEDRAAFTQQAAAKLGQPTHDAAVSAGSLGEAPSMETATPPPAAPIVETEKAPSTDADNVIERTTPSAGEVPAILFDPKRTYAWERPRTAHEERMLQTIAGWEGGFTDIRFDKNVTLYGLTAALAHTERQEYFGTGSLSLNDIEQMMRYTSGGLQQVGDNAPAPEQPRRNTHITEDATQLQCEQLVFMKERMVPSLLLNEFFSDFGFDRIGNRDVQEQIFHLSMNAGAARALYALDQTLHDLNDTRFPYDNPAGKERDNIYLQNAEGAKAREALGLPRRFEDFAARLVGQFNAAAQDKDPAYVEEQFYNSARLFYAELTQVGKQNTQYIRGWLGRADDVYNTPIDQVTLIPRETPDCVRPLEKFEERANATVPVEAQDTAAGICTFPASKRDRAEGAQIIRETLPEQRLPFKDVASCDALGGQFTPTPEKPLTLLP